MPRRHRDQSFRKTDIVRAYRAARAAGIANPRIVIDTTTKQITIAALGDDDPMQARDASSSRRSASKNLPCIRRSRSAKPSAAKSMQGPVHKKSHSR